MNKVVSGLITATLLLAGSHQGRTAQPNYAPDIGAQWGDFADQQIQRALNSDPGDSTPFAESWLASGVAHRSALGWDDPAALHYLDAALSQPNPYGLNYAWDAFQDGTVNPATTVYTITLYQVGEVVLDAYKHGKAAYTDVTDIMRLVVNTPRITVTPGMSLAYSNNANDVKPLYAVHNINQAVAMFLQDCQNAGILWSDAQIKSWITKLNQYEKASYKPAIYGWPYRNGGAQTIQDADHNSVGAIWGQQFYKSTVGVPSSHFMETSDYGYVLGNVAHVAIGGWECVASKRWFPEYDKVIADPNFINFAYEGKISHRLANTATMCTGFAAAKEPGTHFTLHPVRPSLRGTSPRLAPDDMG